MVDTEEKLCIVDSCQPLTLTGNELMDFPNCALPPSIYLIAVERERQVKIERWSLETDDLYTNGELACAATCYAIPPKDRGDAIPFLWPWDPYWWKPGEDKTTFGRMCELAKAGALIAAEIDRLQRTLR